MIYKRFGRTEITMPVLTCGGMRFQQTWDDEGFEVIEKENQENLAKTLDHALSLGINHIETARGYGTSEVQLGKLLPSIPRDTIIVQTKVLPKADPDEFIRDVEKSLSLLQLDYVDLFAIHGINDWEPYEWTVKKGGCLDAAKKLRDKGHFRHLGFSTHADPDIVMKLISTNDFDYVNLHYYYIMQNHLPSLMEAKKRDMGTLIISPNDKGGLLYKPSAKLVDLCKPLSPMIFNDLYCLSHDTIGTLSIGAAKPTDYDEHIKALEYYDQLPKVIQPIKERLDNELTTINTNIPVEALLETLPEWRDVPGEINLKRIIWLWRLFKAFDMLEYGKMRYNLLGNGGHWFPGQKFDPAKEVELSALVGKDKSLVIDILTEAHELFNGEEKKRLSQS